MEEKEKIGKSLRAVEMLQKFKDAMTGKDDADGDDDNAFNQSLFVML